MHEPWRSPERAVTSREEAPMSREAARPVALFRLEGVLLPRPAHLAAAYLASHAQGLGEQLGRLARVALSGPLRLGAQLGLAETAARGTWAPLADMSEDRLRELSREYVERFLRDAVTPVGSRLLREARRAGYHVVLLSEHLEWMAAPLAEELGVEDLLCNRMEVRRGLATGRLLDPVIGPSPSLGWLRREATRRGWDLARGRAYASGSRDALLLGAVGEPCAVRPDPVLRRLAAEHDWAVVDA